MVQGGGGGGEEVWLRCLVCRGVEVGLEGNCLLGFCAGVFSSGRERERERGRGLKYCVWEGEVGILGVKSERWKMLLKCFWRGGLRGRFNGELFEYVDRKLPVK